MCEYIHVSQIGRCGVFMMSVIVSNRLLKFEWYHDAPWRHWAQEKAVRVPGLWSEKGMMDDRGDSMKRPWISEGSRSEKGTIATRIVSHSDASTTSNSSDNMDFHVFFARTESGVTPGR